MKVAITFRNIEHDASIKENMEAKLSKITQKYQLKITSASAVLERKKYHYYAEVILLGKHLKSVGLAESETNVFAAIDEAVSKVDAQLKKHKEKIRDRKSKTSLKKEGFDTPEAEE